MGDRRIQGGISREDARIYHVPGGPASAKTRIDTTHGERWFCFGARAPGCGVKAGEAVSGFAAWRFRCSHCGNGRNRPALSSMALRPVVQVHLAWLLCLVAV